MGRRKEQRVRGILPVKVSGTDGTGNTFSALAHTVDLSATGLRLAGPLPELKLSSTVWVHFQRQKACFTVVRYVRTGPIAEVGLQLSSGEIAWGAEFEPGYVDPFMEALMKA